MNDSELRDALDEKRERDRANRLAAIKRWVAYVEEQPPEVWGEQLNTLVEAQLEAAREAGVSAEQYERVERAGREHRSD